MVRHVVSLRQAMSLVSVFAINLAVLRILYVPLGGRGGAVLIAAAPFLVVLQLVTWDTYWRRAGDRRFRVGFLVTGVVVLIVEALEMRAQRPGLIVLGAMSFTEGVEGLLGAVPLIGPPLVDRLRQSLVSFVFLNLLYQILLAGLGGLGTFLALWMSEPTRDAMKPAGPPAEEALKSAEQGVGPL